MGLGTQNHSVRIPIRKFSSLKIANDNDHGALYFIERNGLLQSTSNISDLSISNIDFFVVELFRVGIGPSVNNFADSDVELADSM